MDQPYIMYIYICMYRYVYMYMCMYMCTRIAESFQKDRFACTSTSVIAGQAKVMVQRSSTNIMRGGEPGDEASGVHVLYLSLS